MAFGWCSVLFFLHTLLLYVQSHVIHWDKAVARTSLRPYIIAIGRNLIKTSDVCSRSVQKCVALIVCLSGNQLGDVLLCQLSHSQHNIKHTLQWNVPGLTHCQTHPDTSLSLASHLMSSFPRQHCYPKPSLETDTHTLPNTQAPTFNHCLGSCLILQFIIYVRGGSWKSKSYRLFPSWQEKIQSRWQLRASIVVKGDSGLCVCLRLGQALTRGPLCKST